MGRLGAGGGGGAGSVSGVTVTGVCLMRDEQISGTAGGASSAATWNVRALNTKPVDTITVALAANRFTPPAGDYRLTASAPSQTVNRNRLGLYNVTGAAFVDKGSNSYHGTGTGGGGDQTSLLTYFTANGTDAYEIRHYTELAVATNGLGVESSAGTEVYCTVHLEKLAD